MSNIVPSGDLVGVGAQLRDDNDSPVSGVGISVSNSKSLTANNTTAAVPIFHINGSVQVLALYGVITSTLGANNTAAYWRINDQSAQTAITAASGTTLSAGSAGGTLVRRGLAATNLLFKDANVGNFSEPTTAETIFFSPFVAVQKTGGVQTDIEFVYTTTDTPTSGTITFFAQYLPLSAGSKLTLA